MKRAQTLPSFSLGLPVFSSDHLNSMTTIKRTKPGIPQDEKEIKFNGCWLANLLRVMKNKYVV